MAAAMNRRQWCSGCLPRLDSNERAGHAYREAQSDFTPEIVVFLVLRRKKDLNKHTGFSSQGRANLPVFCSAIAGKVLNLALP